MKALLKEKFLFLYLVNVYLTYESPFKRKVSVSVLWESVIVLCFVVRYSMSILVLQSS